MIQVLAAAALIAALAPGQNETLSATQIYENTQKIYASIEGFTAVIREETIVGPQSDKAVARLYFKRPALLRLEYYDEKTPDEITQLMVIDGKTAWSYTPFFNQVTRKAIPESRSKEWIPGVGERFETLPKNYNIRRIEDEIAAKRNLKRLQIQRKPKEENEPPPEIIDLWIDSETWLPVQISYTHPSGPITVFQIEKVDIEAEPKENLFTFTPPPGAEVLTIRDEPTAPPPESEEDDK